MNQFTVVKPESSKTLACLCVSSTRNIWGKRWGEIHIKTQQSLQGRLWKWSFPPLPAVYPPSSETTGRSQRAALGNINCWNLRQGSIAATNSKAQAGRKCKTPVSSQKTRSTLYPLCYEIHIPKPSYYIKVFLFMHTKSNAFKTFSLGPSGC